MLGLKYLTKILFFALIFASIFSIYPVYADGNVWLTTNLRKDHPNIFYSRDYRLFVNATTLPSTSLPLNTGTAGWLSVDLGNNAGFSQVGLVAYPDGLHWFAISFYPITCKRGNSHWGTLGCLGNVGDLVSLNNFHQVRIYKPSASGSVWNMYVYDTAGNQYLVAEIQSTSDRIYKASATFEEAYVGSSDPQAFGQFYFASPQYKAGADWLNWAPSVTTTGTHNWADTNPQTSCPQPYGYTPNPLGDWYWFAGSGGKRCSFLFYLLKYDDASPASITYAGSWTQQSGWAKTYGQTISWTNSDSGSATLPFGASNSISRVYAKANNRSSTYVVIDSGSIQSMADFSTPTLWQVAKTWYVSSGSHTIRTQHAVNDGYFTDLDAYVIDIPRFAPGTYDDRAYGVQYIGDWTHGIGWSSAHANTVSYTKEPEAAFTFTFTGTKIDYYFTKASNRGTVAVTIDGINYGTVNQCSTSGTQWQASQSFTGLNADVHTIHIARVGSSSGCSADGYVDVDKLVPQS